MTFGLGCVLALLAVGCSSPAQAGPRITAEPDGASIATPVAVTVDGLPPGETVRVWARTDDRLGQMWESSGEFTADDAGRVDVTTTASAGGTYQGVDAHGLFWSMRLPEGQEAPYPLIGADDVVVELGVDRGGETIARTTLRRVVRSPDARSIPVAEAGLVGDLHLPPGPGPWPGVLLLGGSEGGRPDPAYAALLASQGYAVLGLAYFGEPGLPETLTRIPVGYGLAGARWLAERPEVSDPRIGLVGTSKGAEYALLLASTEPERFGAVVAHAPSDVVWPALGYDPGTGPVSSWTRGGADVPFLAWTPSGQAGAPPPAPGQPVRVAAFYAGAAAGAAPEQRAAARIPVERIAAPVLLTSGGDDGIWPSTAQARRVLDAIEAAGNPHGSRHLDVPGAGHFVGGAPDLPTTRTATPSGPITIEAGGDPAATAAAVRRTFAATLELLQALAR
ncbi:MAG TPA: acyl-CoA thioesterase/bile acid-CoA:amino acid N-acyltransferase family protein [Pseudonocardia sp.]|nr:acyl-CoA thioesterase/bile acid-CoA:amino acid N-acyltransferase family protein [Pseudonocardia sp.]